MNADAVGERPVKVVPPVQEVRHREDKGPDLRESLEIAAKDRPGGFRGAVRELLELIGKHKSKNVDGGPWFERHIGSGSNEEDK